MFRKVSKVALIAFTLSSSFVFAHEGHDELPGQAKSQYGGVVKSGKILNMELVSEGNELSFYPLGHGNEKVDLSALKISAKAQIPKGKSTPLSLLQNGQAFKGTLDFAGSSRATIDLTASYKGKTDNFKFQVERP